jgi:hypothetical protein
MAPRQASSQDKKPESQATPESRATPGDLDESARAGAVMKELRNKLLTARPEELLDGEDAKVKVWGVLMDVAFPSGVATLVSIIDGTSSLYTTTGGGVLGGYVAKSEARAFVAEAGKHLTGMRRTESFPYPAAGRVKFYVLTRDGVFTAEVGMKELGERTHRLSPLYHSSNQVLNQLRLASEKRKQ